MSGLPLESVPSPARAAWIAFRDGLRRLLSDDDVVAVWAHGGTVDPADPPHAGDLDTHVILARKPGNLTVSAIEAAEQDLAREHGVEWDVWYLLADDARGTDQPAHAWRAGRRETSWALHRAHWMAGRYVMLHGAEPVEVVTAPTWAELERELDRELEHVERHVVERDTDPYEATYALLNGSRILHAVETRSVAISKRGAGRWALDRLPARWHPALAAAIRTYDGRPEDGDGSLLATGMAPFVAYVRERLPPLERRASDARPRWSGE